MNQLEGITYSHEHTRIDLSAVKKTDDTNIDCFEETILAYKELREKGVRHIVDATVLGMKRDPLYVQKVAEASGITIIQATGFYIEEFLPPMVEACSIEELADFMIKEIRDGIEDSGIKAGFIGEIGSSENRFTDGERKVFAAAVLAQQKTGVPIMTHTSLGTFGHEQIELLRALGADLSKVVIGHADLSGDAVYVLHMLRQGVYVAFDTIGKENYLPDITRVEMLKAIEEAGFTDKVLLSMDITRKSNMAHKGGIGYSYLLDVFVPLMQEKGISGAFIQNMLVTNPREFFGEILK